MTERLRARGVTVTRAGRSLLDGVDLALAPGELVALLGKNGAGKTTLLRTLAGLVTPDRGEVQLDGAPLLGRPRAAIARALAYLPQAETAEGVEISVRELVALGRTPHGSAFSPLGAADRTAIDRALGAVEMTALAERPLPSLSAGERQRALVGRVLAQETPLLLLDEPTASLDPSRALALLASVRAHLATEGAALVAMHDVFLVARVADRVVVLDDGRLVRAGPPREVLDEDTLGRVLGMQARLVEEGDELVLRARR